MSHVYGPSSRSTFVSLKPKTTFEKRSTSPRPEPLYRTKGTDHTIRNPSVKSNGENLTHNNGTTASLRNPYTAGSNNHTLSHRTTTNPSKSSSSSSLLVVDNQQQQHQQHPSNSTSSSRQPSRTVPSSHSSRSSSIASRTSTKPIVSTSTHPASAVSHRSATTTTTTTAPSVRMNPSSSTTVPPNHRLPPPYPNSREQSQILISHYEQEENYQNDLTNQLRSLKDENSQLEERLRQIHEETERYRIQVASEQGKYLLDQQRTEETQEEIRRLEIHLVQTLPSQLEQAKLESSMIIKDIAQRELLLEMQRDKREQALLEELLTVQNEIEDRWNQVHELEEELNSLLYDTLHDPSSSSSSSSAVSSSAKNGNNSMANSIQYYTTEINDLQHSILLCSGPDGIHRLQRGVKEAKMEANKTKRKFQDELNRWRDTCAELSARKERLRLAKENLLDQLDTIGIISPRTLKKLAGTLRQSLDNGEDIETGSTDTNEDNGTDTKGLQRSIYGYSPSKGSRFAWDEWSSSETETSPKIDHHNHRTNRPRSSQSPQITNGGTSNGKANWITDALAAVKRGKHRAALSTNHMGTRSIEDADDDRDYESNEDEDPEKNNTNDQPYYRPSRSRTRSFLASKILGNHKDSYNNGTNLYPTGRRHRSRSSTSPLHQPKYIAQIGTGSNPNPWNLRKYPTHNHASPSNNYNNYYRSLSPSHYNSSTGGDSNHRQVYSSLEQLEQKTSSLLGSTDAPSPSLSSKSPSPSREGGRNSKASADKEETGRTHVSNHTLSSPRNASSSYTSSSPHHPYEPLSSHSPSSHPYPSSSQEGSSSSTGYVPDRTNPYSSPSAHSNEYNSPDHNMTPPTIAYTATLANDAHTLDPSGRSVSKTKRGAQYTDKDHDTSYYSKSHHQHTTTLRPSLSPPSRGDGLPKGIPSHSEARARSRTKMIPNDVRSRNNSHDKSDSVTASPTASAVTRHMNQLRQSDSTKDMKLKARENAWGRKTNNSIPVKEKSDERNGKPRSVSDGKRYEHNNGNATMPVSSYRAATSSALWAQLDLPVSESSSTVPQGLASSNEDKTIGNTTEADEIRKLLEQLVFHHEQAQEENRIMHHNDNKDEKKEENIPTMRRPKSISPERIAQLANPKQPPATTSSSSSSTQQQHRRHHATPGKGLLRSNFSLLGTTNRNNDNNNNTTNPNVFNYEDIHETNPSLPSKPLSKRVSFRSPFAENKNHDPSLSSLSSDTSPSPSHRSNPASPCNPSNDKDNALYTRLSQPKDRKNNGKNVTSNTTHASHEPFIERHKLLQAYDKSLRGNAANGPQISPRSSRAEEEKQRHTKKIMVGESIDTPSNSELIGILQKATQSLQASTTVPLPEFSSTNTATNNKDHNETRNSTDTFRPDDNIKNNNHHHEDVAVLLEQVHRLSTKATENKVRNDEALTNLYYNTNNPSNTNKNNTNNQTKDESHGNTTNPRSRTPPRPLSSSTSLPVPSTVTPPPSSHSTIRLRGSSLNNNITNNNRGNSNNYDHHPVQQISTVPSGNTDYGHHTVPVLAPPPLPVASSSLPSSSSPSSSSSYVYGGATKGSKPTTASIVHSHPLVSSTLDKELVPVPDALKPMVESALMEALEHAFAKALRNEQ